MATSKKRFEIFCTIVWLDNCRMRRCRTLGQANAELAMLRRNKHYSNLRIVETK